MVNWVILGLVQGVTEFLPVSSSGHLVMMQALFGIHSPGIGVEVAAHFGTLAAVLTLYGRDAVEILLDFLSGLANVTRRRSEGFRTAVFVLVGSVPAAVAGVVWKDAFEKMFENATLAGAGLLATGFVLFLLGGGRRGRSRTGGLGAGEMGAGRALAVGMAQALAIAPGVSRSGMTISAGLASGLRGDQAARFSFLLSIPATAGAVLLGLMDYLRLGGEAPSVGTARAAEAVPTTALAVVAAVAFASGAVAVRYLIGVLRRGGLRPFAYYCWAAGLIALLMGRF